MAYSDNEATEALIRLAVNKYDYDKTAEDTGISAKTLRRWDKNATKKAIPELLERAIERLLMVIPADMKGSDWAITLGILMDKWLLVQGAPTSRAEMILSTLQQLPEEGLKELERQFVEAANGTGIGQSGDSASKE